MLKVKLINGDLSYNKTGIGTYVTMLSYFLSSLCNIETINIKKYEKKILNRSVGGFLSIFLQTNLTVRIKRNDKSIIHSLDPVALHPKSHVLTLMDLIPLKLVKQHPSLKIAFEVNRKRIQNLHKIITLSKYNADEASKILNIDREKFAPICCGVNHSCFYPSETKPSELSDDKYNLVFVGEFCERKNIHLILEALKNADNFRLIRIGPRYQWNENYIKKCMNIAKKHNIDVIDLGYISQSNLKDYYTHADLFIFPSLDEGFGLPPLEAMACGTNALVSPIPVLQEIYGNQAFYFNQFSSESLFDGIEKAIAHKKPASSIINYTKQFNWERTAKETLQIYEEIYNNR